MFNASPQKRKSCFYLADFCSGRFMHSRLQPLVTFSKITVPIPFCGGAELPVNEILTTCRNLACSEMQSAVAAIGSYWHSLLCVPSDQCAVCHHREYFYLSSWSVYTRISFTCTHVCVCAYMHLYVLPPTFANFLSTDLV